MSEPFCYIKFEVVSEIKLKRLMKIVSELSKRKQSDDWQDEPHWREFFDRDELQYFTVLSERQWQEWNEFWFTTPIKVRHSSEMPTPGWDFGSMIDAIYHGDYELINVKVVKDREALLEILPRGWPYGGLNPLKALVRCFGHKIIGFHTGDQPFVQGDPQAPTWSPTT